MNMISEDMVFSDGNKNELPIFVQGNLNKSRFHNRVENLDKMILMSGTVFREPLKAIQNYNYEKRKKMDYEVIQKPSYREDFSKLQAPYPRQRKKFIRNRNRFMDRSCEELFEYLKLYKNTSSVNETRIAESNNDLTSILKINGCNNEEKPKRNVQFANILDENPVTETFFSGENLTREYLNETKSTIKEEIYESNLDEIFGDENDQGSQVEFQINLETDPTTQTIQNTIFSEEFVYNALSVERPIYSEEEEEIV